MSFAGLLPGLGLIRAMGESAFLVAAPASVLFLAAVAPALVELRGPTRDQRHVLRLVQLDAVLTLLGVGTASFMAMLGGAPNPVAVLWAVGSGCVLIAALIVGRGLGDWRARPADGDQPA